MERWERWRWRESGGGRRRGGGVCRLGGGGGGGGGGRRGLLALWGCGVVGWGMGVWGLVVERLGF